MDRGGVGSGGHVGVGRHVSMGRHVTVWGNHGSQGSHGSVGEGSGAGLVRPGVGGEPGGEPQVLAGALAGGNIAPAGSGAVHSLAVTLTDKIFERKYFRN